SGGDAFALELRQLLHRIIGSAEDEEGEIVDAPQRLQLRRLQTVRDATLDEACIDARLRILQELEVLDGSLGGADLENDVMARQTLAISLSEELVSTAGGSGRDGDLPGRRGDEQPERQPGDCGGA